jgi:hypothetical protein
MTGNVTKLDPVDKKDDKKDDERDLFHDLNADGVLSDIDVERYINVVLEAFAIHIERERRRHGLWKEYPAQDQMKQIKIKIERGLRMLEIDPEDQAMRDNTVEELLDIINYSIFGIRLLTGTATEKE